MKNTNLFQKNLNRQTGAASLTDLMLYGIIAIGMLAFLFVLYNYAYPYVKAYQATSNGLAAMRSVNSVYSGQPNFAGLTTAAVASPSIIDQKYLPAAGSISNAYGGAVTFAPATLNGVTNNSQVMTETNVPRKACSYHVNMMAADVDVITVGGTTVKAQNAGVDPAATITQCDTAQYLTIAVTKMKQS